MTDVASSVVLDVLGGRVQEVGQPIIDYIVNVLADDDFDFGEEGEGAFDAIGELLVNVGCVSDFYECRLVCGKLNEKFGKHGLVKPKPTVRSLTTPLRMNDGMDEEAPKKKPEVTDGPLLSERDRTKIERKKWKEERQRESQYQMHLAEMEAVRAGTPVVCVNHDRHGGPAVKDIHMDNFNVSVGGRDLIVDGSLTLSFGRHYGLVGRNGTGKTTFLRHMALHAIDGIPPNCQILHVEQEVEGDDTTALQCVLNTDIERTQLLEEEAGLLALQRELDFEETTEKSNGSIDKDAIAQRLQEIYKRLELIDADSAEARAASILAGLSFSPEMQHRATKAFSGGWRMRIALARALFIEPDLLLLDEPTNHLDLHAVLWLESYLVKWPKTFIVVSHAREFLNTVVTDILHLHGQKLTAYKGNYDTFERTREEQIKNQVKAFESNERSRAHMNKEKAITKQYPNQSKSQQRKLKKLEEEKEKAYMFSKAQENLEKYKISTGLYNVLEASKDIGKAKTRREKRRNAVLFSKEGLEDPQSDRAPKRRHGSDAYGETEPDLVKIQRQHIDENEPLQPMIGNKEVDGASVSLGSFQELLPDDELGSNNETVAALPPEEVSNKDNSTGMEYDIRNSTAASSIYDGGNSSKSTDGPYKSLNINASMTGNLRSSLQRPLAGPIVVHVSRPNEVENNRKDLPIVMMEQEIMEAVNDNSAVIICGETGCGKTTQVPQFLFEAGFGSNRCSSRSGRIGVTQPRRVAVLATAKRVAFELGLHLSKEVGFQVRHDKKIGDSCSIKFMTDGILLRELKYDVLLRQYSVIILDEAHERSLNTDILIGMLSRIIQPRQALYEKQQQLLRSGQCIEPKDRVFPLKLILMSATLRVEDFISGGRLFRNPPIIEVPTRQFPVTVHFSKRTEIVDYIGQAYKKVMSIHKRLPQGGILVFVTGQREVEYLCSKLCKASKQLLVNSSKENKGNQVVADSEPNATKDINMKEINEAFEIQGYSTEQQTDRFSSCDEDQFDIDDNELDALSDSETESETEILGEDEKLVEQKCPMDGDDPVDVLKENWSLGSLKLAFEALSGKNASGPSCQMKLSTPAIPEQCTELPPTPPTPEQCPELSSPDVEKMGDNKRAGVGALCVLPLYAMLPAAAQLCVFEDVKEGERLVVVSTNVAETSLTIPGIKYVVDTGREKVKKYNSANGIEAYEIQWISKASAAQRAGRAGRTAPGHCYRLYSSAVFNNILPDFSCAEISKVPVDGVVLLMKSMNIDKVSNFPFPTPPEATALVEAERCLKALEALDSNGRLTALGKAMAHYPMSPRHSRMLLTLIQTMKVKSYARANLVLGYGVAAAAALSVSNPFVLQLEGTQTNSNDSELEERDNALDSEDPMCSQKKLGKRKLKEVAKLSHAKFSNPTSDVLTVAYALQCFELSKSPVEFCNEYALHLKTMEEMSKLRKQLLHLLFNQNVNSDQDFSWTHGTLGDVEHSWRISSSKNVLLQNEEELLCRAVCAGWADRVAKRIRAKSGSSAGERKVNAVRYQACMVKEDVFLHRRSSVANSAPEFLVYSELLHTKRPYMHGATRVKADWLVEYARPLCLFSKSLEGSKYNYDCYKDQVLYWVNPLFGPHQWELPWHSLPVSRDDEHRVAVFACALLEGWVLPCLRYVQKFLVAHPRSILKTEESGQRRVGKLLNKLKTKSIDSCAMLKKAWEENPRVLHSEILEWFQKGFHNKFEELWSKMLAEVHLEPRYRFSKERGEE